MPPADSCNWHHQPSIWNRRDLLLSTGGGFLGLALNHLLAQEGLLAAEPDVADRRGPLAPKPAHHPASAKAMIFLFCYGGPSQVDLFDPKPALDEWHGKPIPVFKKEDAFFPDTKPTAYRSPYAFRKHGQAGIDISEKFPELAKWADELCVIRSLHCESNNHAPALFQMNTGFILPGRPSMGSWITYGLGSESDKLPACAVMWDHRGGPIGGAQDWTSGFLPAAYQATPLRSQGDPIVDLRPPAAISAEQQRARLKLLTQLNEKHLERHPGEADFLARINSYELAFRMQMAAPEVIDLDQEPDHIKKLYGLDDPMTAYFGRQCLLARRLVERGVRFVQLYSGGGHQQESWDAHFGIKENHDLHCAETDKPIAGLIADLKQRGLLDSTLLLWGGEFGRMPTNQGSVGRDHNPRGFTMWLAGGGVKGGQMYGSTDEFGYAAVEHPTSLPDLHATCLHLMGLDHKRLTFRHMGRDMRLTDVSGEVIQAVLKNG
ncbi:MAG TPA: DUF1501 domain-containing protein [Gemmatales bacterium]|nr:DUF1501 domain-containing protein [Gemmatales bacterium]